MQMNPIELTPELKSLVKATVHTMAWVETVYPIVTGYQKTILKELNAMDDENNLITEPKYSFRLSEELAKVYFSRCEEEAERNNLVHKLGCCPLLEAETAEKVAKRALGEYMLPRLPGFEKCKYEDLLSISHDSDGKVKRDKLNRYIFKSDELIDIILRFIVPQMHNELKYP